MKVLWFTLTPSLYSSPLSGYGGCGWISSLEEAITSQPDIELGIGFFHSDLDFKVQKGNVCYYPISINIPFWKKPEGLFFPKHKETNELKYFLKIIEDFKPDVIHVFGSESSFGLLTEHTDIPVVIHIQGLLNPCKNAFFPPGTTKYDYIKHLNIKEAIQKLITKIYFNRNAYREEIILKGSRAFLGRTEWDKRIARLYAPGAKYFYCSEILREPFYTAPVWKYRDKDDIKIISTISKTDYKGFDLVLKTAFLFKQLTGCSFVWNVFGISNYTFWERKLKIKAHDVGVNLRGVANPEELISTMIESDMFVHPSYIDNSPNSVCEAQMIGVPVIATNVGGIRSLIEEGESGVLVPANDPYMLLSYILELKNNQSIASRLGANGREVAAERHNKENIIADNVKIYRSLINRKHHS